MKIYRVVIEHTSYGENWTSYKVDARTFKEVVKKVEKKLTSSERIESVIVLASTD